MKSKLITFTIAVIAVTAVGIGLAGFTYVASAQSPEAAVAEFVDNGFARHRGPGGPGGEDREESPLKEYAEAAVADILSISVEDLQAAREDGTPMSDLIEAAGLTEDEFKAEMEAALPGILDQAVLDGAIDQETADHIAENGFRRGGKGHHRHGFGPLSPYLQAEAAAILGVEVETLEGLKDSETSFDDLLSDAGLTSEEFRAEMEAALPGILDQAVIDGAIDQETADLIAENGLKRPHKGGENGPNNDA
jgi:uncharacterized protein YidB (DUF937 family)